MHAVGGIDLQAIRAVIVLHELINASRAVALLGAGKLGQVDRHRYRVVLQRQVRWLVLFVIDIADIDAGEAVKGQLAIRLGIVDGLSLIHI